jgi:serine/threonine-protein phosphatase 2A regulatory subunit B'
LRHHAHTRRSIINGFALPLKPEHLTFLERCLMPLHRPRTGLPTYYQQLTYCVAQYLEKDRAATAPLIVACLCRSWPWCSSSKQVRRAVEESGCARKWHRT